MRGSLYKDYMALQSIRENSIVNVLKERAKVANKELDNKRSEIDEIKNRRNVQRESVANYREYVLTELTITAMQAIYMSAVTECGILTRESKIVGENMAVNYIKENGGVYSVLSKMEGTYFLERLRDIIYEAAEEEEKKKEESENQKEEEKKDSENKDDNVEKSEDDEDLVSDISNDEDDDSSTEDKSEEDKEEKPNEGDDNKEENEDNDSTEEIDVEVDEEPEDITNKDISPETKEEMLDKLEKEEDTDKAVDIIAQRISSAEEEFIKKNAQDKQKIEDIVNDINDRINGAKADPNNSDEDMEEIEQECTLEMKRKINAIRDDRPHSVFEMMVRQLSEGIMNDQTLMEDYCDQNGKINIDTVVEVTRSIYGFLEFVNTVQLEKVNEAYIKHVIDSI